MVRWYSLYVSYRFLHLKCSLSLVVRPWQCIITIRQQLVGRLTSFRRNIVTEYAAFLTVKWLHHHAFSCMTEQSVLNVRSCSDLRRIHFFFLRCPNFDVLRRGALLMDRVSRSLDVDDYTTEKILEWAEYPRRKNAVCRVSYLQGGGRFVIIDSVGYSRGVCRLLHDA